MDALGRNSVPYILQPIDIVTSVNLKTATAGARIARYVVPPAQVFVNTNTFQHGWEILGVMWAQDGAGGNNTTAAQIELVINGANSTVNSNLGTSTHWSQLNLPPGTSPSTTPIADGAEFTATVESVVFPLPPPQLGSIPGGANPGTGQPNTYFPTVQGGDVLEVWLNTQGVGGNALTGRPFVVVRPKLIPGLTS